MRLRLAFWKRSKWSVVFEALDFIVSKMVGLLLIVNLILGLLNSSGQRSTKFLEI